VQTSVAAKTSLLLASVKVLQLFKKVLEIGERLCSAFRNMKKA